MTWLDGQTYLRWNSSKAFVVIELRRTDVSRPVSIQSTFSTVSTISVPIPSSHFPLRWGWYSVPRARRPEHVTLPSRRSRIGGTRYYQSLLDSGRFENRAALARYRGVSWAKVTHVLRRLLACLCQPTDE